jgi:hypothetical protein
VETRVPVPHQCPLVSEGVALPQSGGGGLVGEDQRFTGTQRRVEGSINPAIARPLQTATA